MTITTATKILTITDMMYYDITIGMNTYRTSSLDEAVKFNMYWNGRFHYRYSDKIFHLKLQKV